MASLPEAREITVAAKAGLPDPSMNGQVWVLGHHRLPKAVISFRQIVMPRKLHEVYVSLSRHKDTIFG